MAKPKPEPIGRDYWTSLSKDQGYLAAALRDEYCVLRSIIEQRNKDSGFTVTAHVRWEKLLVLGLLEVDLSRTDTVWVRRGQNWKIWWDRVGEKITGTQLAWQDFAIALGAIFPERLSIE